MASEQVDNLRHLPMEKSLSSAWMHDHNLLRKLNIENVDINRYLNKLQK